MGFDLSLNFLNRNKPTDKPTDKSTENIGEWKDPQPTHHTSDNDDISVANDFMCMYCLNIDSYRHFIRTSIDPSEPFRHPARKLNSTAVPYSPDWSSFKRHMYMAHPEQWGYTEVPNAYTKVTKDTQRWSKTDKEGVGHAYIQIRARVEYGWNFFVVINGEIHRTLHSLPKDESTITSIVWYPRVNPLTKSLWTDWRFEKEGETHKRAQNALPCLIGRTHASITPILRGMRVNGPQSNGNDGHVLVAKPLELSKYAHLPPWVNTQCIFTDKALQQVRDLRTQCGLEGPGNIGILRLQPQPPQEEPPQEGPPPSATAGVPTVPTPSAPVPAVMEVEKEEKGETEKTVSTEVLVTEDKFDITGNNINAQDIATKLEQLLPKNDFSKMLMEQVEVIFNVAREQSESEDAFYDEHKEHEATKLELEQAHKDANEAAKEAEKSAEEAKKTIEGLRAEVATLKSRSTKVHKGFDDVSEKSKDRIRRGPRIT